MRKKQDMILSKNKFKSAATYDKKTYDIDTLLNTESVNLFDQNGYHLKSRTIIFRTKWL